MISALCGYIHSKIGASSGASSKDVSKPAGMNESERADFWRCKLHTGSRRPELLGRSGAQRVGFTTDTQSS